MQVALTWKQLVAEALKELGGEASLQDIYAFLAARPDRPQTATWQATVRRVLRQYKAFEPIPGGGAAYRLVPEAPVHLVRGRSGHDPHGEVQGMLLQLGRICRYETYTNATDKTIRKIGGVSIAQFATVRNDAASLTNLPLERVRNIDVMWMAEDDQGLYPLYAFEVEESTRVKNGLLRLLKIPLRYKTMLYVIGRSDEEQVLFTRYLEQSPFREHARRFRFKLYDDVKSFHTFARGFDSARMQFGVETNEA